MGCWFVKLPELTRVFFFSIVFFEAFFFVFIFDIRLLGLELSIFFFYWFFQSHISGCVLVNLTWLSQIIIAWIFFFSVCNSLVRPSVWHGPHSFQWTTLKIVAFKERNNDFPSLVFVDRLDRWPALRLRSDQFFLANKRNIQTLLIFFK